MYKDNQICPAELANVYKMMYNESYGTSMERKLYANGLKPLWHVQTHTFNETYKCTYCTEANVCTFNSITDT